MYKVIYQLPFNDIKESFIEEDELNGWLNWPWAKERIIYCEEVK